jgi:hypothetical protein
VTVFHGKKTRRLQQGYVCDYTSLRSCRKIRNWLRNVVPESIYGGATNVDVGDENRDEPRVATIQKASSLVCPKS